MEAFWRLLEPWIGLLGWCLLLLGYLLQRRALMSAKNTTSIKGNKNIVSNTISQVSSAGNESTEGALSRWGNWASILGLGLALWTLVLP